MIWVCWVLWHINHCRLFNAKSSLYIYTKYMGFGWVRFYGISTIVGYFKYIFFYFHIFNFFRFYHTRCEHVLYPVLISQSPGVMSQVRWLR